MISEPHEHQLGVALVACRNQAAEEQRVALSDVGEDTGFMEQAIFDTHDDWSDLVQCW